MKNLINEYILFLLKLITIIIIITIPIIILILNKDKKIENIEIENINKKYEQIKKKILLKTTTKVKILKKEKNGNIYIIKFNGDIYAREITKLKEIISVIISIIKDNDEILLIINSNGGLVNNYGFAASQIERIKKNNIKLTVSIDLIAASGGYLIACVANEIIASQFAIIGSIGVIGQIPNFNRLLEKNSIDIEQHTSGDYKTTLTILGKNTEKGRKKFCETLVYTHELFKDFIKKHRQNIVIDKVSNGDFWYAEEALKLKLIDKIQTSDEFIMENIEKKNIFEIKIKEQKTLINKLTKKIMLNLTEKI